MSVTVVHVHFQTKPVGPSQTVVRGDADAAVAPPLPMMMMITVDNN